MKRDTLLLYIPLWVTFFVCLLWALEWGILIGAAVHVCMLLYFQAKPVVTAALRESTSGAQRVVVVEIAYGLLFPNSKIIKKRPCQAGVQHLPLLVVLDCAHVTVVDYTAALAIRDLCKEFSERQQRVAFANMCPRVRDSLLVLSPNLEDVDLPSLVISSELPLNLAEGGKEGLRQVPVDVLHMNGGDRVHRQLATSPHSSNVINCSGGFCSRYSHRSCFARQSSCVFGKSRRIF